MSARSNRHTVEEYQLEVSDGLPGLMPRLWRYGLVLSGDSDAAHALAQASAARALERRKTFKSGARLDHWCFSILSSIWKNDQPTSARRSGDGAAPPDSKPDVEINPLAHELLGAVTALPEAEREALFLVNVEGYSYAEAANQLGIAPAAVMTHLSTARSHLKGSEIEAQDCEPTIGDGFTDEQIVAFLDGEMDDGQQVRFARTASQDATLEARVEALALDTDALRDGLDMLLIEAPFIEIKAPVPDEAVASKPEISRDSGRMALGAVVLLGLGAWLGMLVADRPQQSDWLDEVARLQALYTAETFVGMPVDDKARAQGLKLVSSASGIALTSDLLAIDGLDFQRIQLLHFDGKPLAHIAYLDHRRSPVSLFLRKTDGIDLPPSTIERDGLASTNWQEAGRGFIVIGNVSPETLGAARQQIASQIMP